MKSTRNASDPMGYKKAVEIERSPISTPTQASGSGEKPKFTASCNDDYIREFPPLSSVSTPNHSKSAKSESLTPKAKKTPVAAAADGGSSEIFEATPVVVEAVSGIQDLPVEKPNYMFIGSAWEEVETLMLLPYVVDNHTLQLLQTCIKTVSNLHANALEATAAHVNSITDVRIIRECYVRTEPFGNKCAKMYAYVALLEGTSRHQAFSIAQAVNELCDMFEHKEWPAVRFANDVDTLASFGKLITAIVNHPAFSVEDRSYFFEFLKKLKQYKEQLLHRSTAKKNGTSQMFVVEISTTQIMFLNSELPISVRWSDGIVTVCKMTRTKLFDLHFKLLDHVGQECDSSGRRFLTHLAKNGVDKDYIMYVNSLGDLPARIFMSPKVMDIFREAFEYSRPELSIFLRCEDAESSSDDGSLCFKDDVTPSPELLNFDDCMVFVPSCPNCGGDHFYKDCGRCQTNYKKDTEKRAKQILAKAPTYVVDLKIGALQRSDGIHYKAVTPDQFSQFFVMPPNHQPTICVPYIFFTAEQYKERFCHVYAELCQRFLMLKDNAPEVALRNALNFNQTLAMETQAHLFGGFGQVVPPPMNICYPQTSTASEDTVKESKKNRGNQHGKK